MCRKISFLNYDIFVYKNMVDIKQFETLNSLEYKTYNKNL